MPEPRNYTRGHLPHRDRPGATQFVTWRLYDALDAERWEGWKAEYRGEEGKAKLYGLAEKTLDRHEGSAVFRRVDLGRIVMDRLFDGEKDDYRMLAAVVMPNHVHAVLRIERKAELGDVMKAIEGGSAFYVNQAMDGREGSDSPGRLRPADPRFGPFGADDRVRSLELREVGAVRRSRPLS